MKIPSLPADSCTVARAMTCTLNANAGNLYNILFPPLCAKSSCKTHYQELITTEFPEKVM